MTISVVIPALNESVVLPRLIASLRGFQEIEEIIVADGGSTDGTLEWCNLEPSVVLVGSSTGKGSQLNAGAACAKGDFLLFLHADSLLSAIALQQMQVVM